VSVEASEREQGAREVALLARLQRGEQRALAELYESLSRPVYSLAYAMLRSREEAEEVVQDSFMKLYTQAGRFDPERGSVRAYLYAIARNGCLSRLRQRAARPQASDHDPHDPAFAHDGRFGEHGPDVVLGVVLDGALERLGEPEKTLLRKVYFDGYSHRDLAEHLDMPLGTLKTKVRRALLALREHLEGR
jgi:RNA polymerase sigma-70 factor, ECF subfamily